VGVGTVVALVAAVLMMMSIISNTIFINIKNIMYLRIYMCLLLEMVF
jgi:hypothetical protein